MFRIFFHKQTPVHGITTENGFSSRIVQKLKFWFLIIVFRFFCSFLQWLFFYNWLFRLCVFDWFDLDFLFLFSHFDAGSMQTRNEPLCLYGRSIMRKFTFLVLKSSPRNQRTHEWKRTQLFSTVTKYWCIHFFSLSALFYRRITYNQKKKRVSLFETNRGNMSFWWRPKNEVFLLSIIDSSFTLCLFVLTSNTHRPNKFYGEKISNHLDCYCLCIRNSINAVLLDTQMRVRVRDELLLVCCVCE